MSVQSTLESAQCSYCNGDRDPHASVAGSFCSTTCYYRHKGVGVLDTIRLDHRFCSTCFRQVKTVDRPSDDELEAIGVPQTIRDVFRGYQYPTDATEFGEFFDVENEDTPLSHRRSRPTWGCECGALDFTERDDTLERVEGANVVLNLLRCLLVLHHQGAIQRRPEKDRLFDAFREQGRDYEYAIGKALYEGP